MGITFGLNTGKVVGDLPRYVLLGPTQLGRHPSGNLGGDVSAPIGGLAGDSRPTGENVFEVESPLIGHRIYRFGFDEARFAYSPGKLRPGGTESLEDFEPVRANQSDPLGDGISRAKVFSSDIDSIGVRSQIGLV